MPLSENVKPYTDIEIMWSVYRLAMLQNSAYQRITSATADRLSVGRIETFFAIEAGSGRSLVRCGNRWWRVSLLRLCRLQTKLTDGMRSQ